MFNELFPDDEYDLPNGIPFDKAKTIILPQELVIKPTVYVIRYLGEDDKPTQCECSCDTPEHALKGIQDDLKNGYALAGDEKGFVVIPIHRVLSIRILTDKDIVTSD